jgi:hypothetical protein
VIAAARAAISPIGPSSDPSTPLPPSSVLRIAHRLVPAAGLWCIGQVAWSPCEQVHSSGLTRAVGVPASNGASVSAATWQMSQQAAKCGRARRTRVTQQ